MVEFKSTENGVAIVVTLLLPPNKGIHETIKKHSEALAPRTQNIVKDFPEVACVDAGKTDDNEEYFRATFMPRDIAVKSYKDLYKIIDKCVADTKLVYSAIYSEVQEFLKSLEAEPEDVTNQATETKKFESLGEFLQEVFKDIISMEKGDKITFTIELS